MDFINTSMKIDNIIQEIRRRQYGNRIDTTDITSKYVYIYRAVTATQDYFLPEDYVTPSLKFAKGHADHTAVVHEEDQHVIMLRVEATDVYEATNPGEWFYDGPKKKGRRVYFVDAFGS